MPSANNAKVRRQINRRLYRGHPGHARPVRSTPEAGQEVGDRSRRSSHVHFHCAVGAIADGATQAEAGSLPPRPPAETYALYAAFKDDSGARFGAIWLH